MVLHFFLDLFLPESWQHFSPLYSYAQVIDLAKELVRGAWFGVTCGSIRGAPQPLPLWLKWHSASFHSHAWEPSLA